MFLFRIFGFLVKLLLTVLFFAVLSAVLFLFWAQRGFSPEMLNKASEALSTETVSVGLDRASFHVLKGLAVQKIRVAVVGEPDAFLTVDEVRIGLHPKLSVPSLDWVSFVSVKNLNLSRIPKIPPRTERPQKESAGSSAPLAIPYFDRIQVRFEKVSVLGIAADEVSTDLKLNMNGDLCLESASVRWYGRGKLEESVTGTCRFDFKKEFVYSSLAGRTLPYRLYPLFQLLHLKTVEDYCRLFEFPPDSLPDATCTFTLSFGKDDNTTLLAIGVAARDFSYRGEPIERVDGVINIDGRKAWIGPLRAVHKTGVLEGRLLNDGAAQILTYDAHSTLQLQPLSQILDLVKRPITNFVFAVPPMLSATGALRSVGTTLDSVVLDGRFKAGAGSVYRIGVSSAEGLMRMTNSVLSFEAVKAGFADDGKALLDLTLMFRSLDVIDFKGAAVAEKVPLEAFGALAGGAAIGSYGQISGHVELAGCLTDEHPSLSFLGSGKLKVHNGRLNRLKLFAGFTDYLAKNVPGVEGLVDQTQAEFSFGVTNGVISTRDVDIHGDVFGVKMQGSYDIHNDCFDAVARTVFFKEKSVARTVSSFLSYPMSRLFMELRLGGTLEDPKWTYIGLIDKVGGWFTSDANKEEK